MPNENYTSPETGEEGSSSDYNHSSSSEDSGYVSTGAGMGPLGWVLTAVLGSFATIMILGMVSLVYSINTRPLQKKEPSRIEEKYTYRYGQPIESRHSNIQIIGMGGMHELRSGVEYSNLNGLTFKSYSIGTTGNPVILSVSVPVDNQLFNALDISRNGSITLEELAVFYDSFGNELDRRVYELIASPMSRRFYNRSSEEVKKDMEKYFDVWMAAFIPRYVSKTRFQTDRSPSVFKTNIAKSYSPPKTSTLKSPYNRD